MTKIEVSLNVFCNDCGNEMEVEVLQKDNGETDVYINPCVRCKKNNEEEFKRVKREAAGIISSIA
jgi:uncharacterized Zn finger protein